MSHLDHLAEQTRSTVQRRTVATLSATAIFTGVGIAGTTAAGSLLIKDITGSGALSGLSQTFSVLGAAFMALPLARLTARGGRRLALLTGWSTAAIGMLIAVAGGALANVPLMLIGSLVGGTGAASGFQARFAAVDLALPEHRARDLSLVVWASTVGSVSGPNLLPYTTKITPLLGLPPLVGPYLFASLMLLIGVAIAFVLLRPDPFLLASKENANRKAHSIRASLKLVRENLVARQAITGIVIGHLAMVAVMVMTPVHMGEHAASLTVIGFVISVHVLGMYAFSPVMGWLADRIGRLMVVRMGATILITALFVSGLANPMDDRMLAVGLFLLGLGWSATLVGGSTLLAESVDVADRPTAQGASDLLMNGAAAVGGAIAGVIIAEASYSVLCGVTLIPVGYLLWATRRIAP